MEEQLIIELKEKYEDILKEIIKIEGTSNNSYGNSFTDGRHYEVANIISDLGKVLKIISSNV